MIPDYAQPYYPNQYVQGPLFDPSAPPLPHQSQTPLFYQPCPIYPQPQPSFTAQASVPPQPPLPVNSFKKQCLTIATSCIALGALGIVSGALIENPVVFGVGLLLIILGMAATIPSGARLSYFPRIHCWQWHPHWQRAHMHHHHNFRPHWRSY